VLNEKKGDNSKQSCGFTGKAEPTPKNGLVSDCSQQLSTFHCPRPLSYPPHFVP
jgi:hypothetical protein